jgi:ubiquinol-cytochrome c reductase cytochrome c subunit
MMDATLLPSVPGSAAPVANTRSSVSLRRQAGSLDARAVGGWGALLAVLAIVLVTSPRPAIALGAAMSDSHAQVSSSAAAGESLYQSQCASCHGVQGEGAQYGPSLVGAGAAGADFYLRTGRMPLSAPGQPVTRRQPVLTDDQIRDLVATVAAFGPGPDIPQVTEGGDVSDGSRLYVANCAACHGATGAGNAIGGGALAANLQHASPVEIVEAMRIGPGAMPRFAFSPDEEASIAAYVERLRDQPSPGGLEIGGLGAVSEGFIAVGLGLVLFVLAAMFVGRRTHEADSDEAGAAES